MFKEASFDLVPCLDLDFLSLGKKEKGIFDGMLKLLDTVSEGVEAFEASVLAFARGTPTPTSS